MQLSLVKGTYSPSPAHSPPLIKLLEVRDFFWTLNCVGFPTNWCQRERIGADVDSGERKKLSWREDVQGCAGERGPAVSSFHCWPVYRSHQLWLGYSSWLFRLGHGPEATSCQYKGRNVTLSLQCQGGEICRLVCDLHCWPMQVLFKGSPHSALDTDTRLKRENEKSPC